MKIIFLNTLGGKVRDPLAEYIKSASLTTDIFCFQEAYESVRNLCRDILHNWQEVTAHKDIRDDDFCLATYLKDLKLVSSQVLGQDSQDIGLGLYTKVALGDDVIHIGNFHGIAEPGDKLDNPERIKQSRTLIEFFKAPEGPKIVGGDFNLLPETESIGIFARNGYRDLIREFKVPTTRNRLIWDLFPQNRQYYSDYVFINSGIEIKKFSVPSIEISDHLPLELELEF